MTEVKNTTVTNNTNTPKDIKKAKINLKLKKEVLENNASIKISRNKEKKTIDLAWIKDNAVEAIHKHHLEYLFDNSPEELSEVIRRVDSQLGLTNKSGYQTRPLRGINRKAKYDVV